MWLSAFLFLNVKTVIFFLVYNRALKYNKISFCISLKAIIYNKEIGKPDESLGRKATGPVKWQPVA